MSDSAAVPPPAPAVPDERDTVPTDTWTLDDLNRDGTLPPVFFDCDSADLETTARETVESAATVLREHPSWIVAIEGYCDERGTSEYNLALGERRAAAVEVYLISLGVPANRLRIVSYGEEFPFDPGDSEGAWTQNRVQFVVIAE